MDWWSKGSISGEYRDIMTGELLSGIVVVINSRRITTSNGIIIPVLPMYRRQLNTEGDLSFDFDVFASTDPHINEEFFWHVTVKTATAADVYRISLDEGEAVKLSDLETLK